MIKVTYNPLIQCGPTNTLKAIYTVRSWSAEILLLVGTAQEVFTELGITGKGSKQRKFLDAYSPGDVAMFLDGTCVLLGQTNSTQTLRAMLGR